MRKGQVAKDRVGEVKTMKCGLLATIIKYESCSSIEVEFENGVKKHSRYHDFHKGIIIPKAHKLTNRLGETRMMKCGLKCTIIKYINHRHVLVRFENGFEKETRYARFLAGSVTLKIAQADSTNQSRLGQTRIMKCGEEAQIIKSTNSSNIIVKFLKSGIEKHATYKAFCEGLISPKEKVDWKEIIKKTFVSNRCGLKYVVVGKSENSRKCIIRFEDGTLRETCYREAYEGGVVHPGFNKAGRMINFLGYSGNKIKINNKIWYKIENIGLVTPQQLVKEFAI